MLFLLKLEETNENSAAVFIIVIIYLFFCSRPQVRESRNHQSPPRAWHLVSFSFLVFQPQVEKVSSLRAILVSRIDLGTRVIGETRQKEAPVSSLVRLARDKRPSVLLTVLCICVYRVEAALFALHQSLD